MIGFWLGNTVICVRGRMASNQQKKQGDGANLRDVTKVFKKILVELAMDKIWLEQMKIWCMVRDETVGAENESPLAFPTSDVVSTLFMTLQNMKKKCYVYIKALTDWFCHPLVSPTIC